MSTSSKNIIYLTAYINERISKLFNLPYSKAGLDKKDALLQIMESDYNTYVIFSAIFNRLNLKYFGSQIIRCKNRKIIVPAFYLMPIINIIFNPIFILVTLLKLNIKRKVDIIVLYNCNFENVIPSVLFKLIHPRVKIICQYEDGWIVSKKGFNLFLFKIANYLAIKKADGALFNNTNFKKIFPIDKFMMFRGIESLAQNAEIINYKPNSKFRVTFSGAIDKIRGVELLIQLFNNTDNNIILNNASFFITGKGNLEVETKLKESICRFNSKGGDAKYLGFVEDNELKKILNSSDILLALQNPNLAFSEFCFPSKVFDYLHYNKPIITTKISDLDRLKEFVLYFTNYNIKSLETQIEKVTKNYSHYLKNNSRNSEIKYEKYNVDANTKRFNKFIQSI